MSYNSAAWIILFAVCVAVQARGQTAGARAPGDAVLEEVLVTGERPGPGLWQVSKDGHDLWILGTLEPLPTGMTWRSQSVLARVASSQAVLAPPDADAHIGFFRSLSLLPSAFRARHRPDGATLEQSLPHDLYIRWLALRVKYLNGANADEKLRPMLAAFNLYQRALEESGLTMRDGVWDTVEKAARKDRVPIVAVTIDIPIEDPKGLVRSLENIPLEREIECFSTVVRRVEVDIQPMRQRANFWALGDVAGLTALRAPDEGVACLDALAAVPVLSAKLELAKRRVHDLWITTAEAAIAKYPSSFAVLPIHDLTGSDGWLAELEAKGYSVIAP